MVVMQHLNTAATLGDSCCVASLRAQGLTGHDSTSSDWAKTGSPLDSTCSRIPASQCSLLTMLQLDPERSPLTNLSIRVVEKQRSSGNDAQFKTRSSTGIKTSSPENGCCSLSATRDFLDLTRFICESHPSRTKPVFGAQVGTALIARCSDGERPQTENWEWRG